MKITKFKKMTGSRYKLYFEDESELVLYEDVILKNGLLLKKEIDEDNYDRIMHDNVVMESYDKCLKLISTKLRSKNEIEKLLVERGLSNNELKEIMGRLEKNNLINDDILVKCYINDKVNLTNDGPFKIRNDLKRLGVSEVLIDNNIDNIASSLIQERICHIVSKDIRANKKYSGNILKMRLLNHLINLGYDKMMVLDEISKHNLSNNNLSKEYEKLVKKYKDKYDDKKLSFVIKNKLMAKGYSLSEIQDYFNE